METKKKQGYELFRSMGNPVKVVAPMVDASELAWRMLSRKYEADLCYTPMLHSGVFVRDKKYRTESLQTCPEDRPLIVQFCANDPDTFLTAVTLAMEEIEFDAVDLNLGCPQVIARRGHFGSFLQDEWELLHKMVSIVHSQGRRQDTRHSQRQHPVHGRRGELYPADWRGRCHDSRGKPHQPSPLR